MIEYYTNGGLKHRICYYPNGNKYFERFYDQQGYAHRDGGLPDYQKWDKNGITEHKTYYVHGEFHNIYNPSYIGFIGNGKIQFKQYWIKRYKYSKLNWMNCIKNI